MTYRCVQMACRFTGADSPGKTVGNVVGLKVGVESCRTRHTIEDFSSLAPRLVTMATPISAEMSATTINVRNSRLRAFSVRHAAHKHRCPDIVLACLRDADASGEGRCRSVRRVAVEALCHACFQSTQTHSLATSAAGRMLSSWERLMIFST